MATADPHPNRLDGRTIVVTGAASGIGLAITRRCLDDGAHVVLLDRDDVLLRDTAATLGPAASTGVVDVTDEDAIRRALEDVPGPIHGLVNSAGIMTTGDVTTVTPEAFGRCIEVNLTGTYLMTLSLIHI